ncbi:unnamed protein product [Heterobilharzia americana]|nr:unnamed protein product [Heterobilharzia americana]
MNKSSTDFEKKSVDNQHSDQLSTKKSSRRDLINTKRCTSIGLSSTPKLSSTFKSRLASSSTTVRAKKFVSKLSKLAKRKTVVNESRILSRRTAKLLSHKTSSNECSLDVDDSLKSKLSESFSPTGKNEENSRKSNHLDENSSRQSAFKGHQNVGCSSSSLITTIATASNTSVTVKYEDNKSISSVRDLPLKDCINKRQWKYRLFKKFTGKNATLSKVKPNRFITKHDKFKLLSSSRMKKRKLNVSFLQKKFKRRFGSYFSTNDDNGVFYRSGTKSQKNGTKKRSLLKDKGVNILSHSKKKLNPVSVMDKPNTSESISVHERIEADPNGLSNVNVKKMSSDKTSRKSVIKLKTKKPLNSTKENQLNKLTEYSQSIPYCEDISDMNSSSDEDERETVIKSSRSRLRHSTRNSANSSTNSYKKRKSIHKSLTVTSNISSNSSDTYSEREANHTSEISQNESSASGSESVYNPSDALPRLTRSQHKQLLGDTPPGSALQTAAPATSNRTVSISFPTKIVSSSKRLQTKDINKSVLLKEEQANKMENNEISSSIITTGGETSSSSSETDHSQVNIPNTETVNQVKEENIQKVEDDTTFGNENTESTEVDGIDVCVKQEVIESATIQSVPDLSPEIYDDKQVDDVMMNECLLEDTISQPINIGDKQEEVEEEDGKTVEDNDTEDDRCSVQTMSTDPMDGLLYDLTMSSEKSHMQLSSKENDDLEEIDNPVNLSPHHTDITEEGGALSSTEDHPVSEISNEKEVDETTVNKTSLEPMIEKNEEEDKISEVEQANILKSRKRVRRSSNTSNSIDTPSKRGNKRTYLAPHRSTTVSENSPVRSFDSPHYPPVSPHSVPTTSVSSPMPNCSKSNDRSTSSNRRFGGPFFPIAGFDDLSSDAKCQVLQERMHRILEAWRLAKQYLKNLDQRNNRTRRLKGRQNLETSTSLGSQDNRQLVDEAHTSNDFPCT